MLWRSFQFIYDFGELLMNNKKLFVILFISFILIFSTTLIIFSILGNKNRIGYLGEFKFDESHINNTLELMDLIHLK